MLRQHSIVGACACECACGGGGEGGCSHVCARVCECMSVCQGEERLLSRKFVCVPVVCVCVWGKGGDLTCVSARVCVCVWERGKGGALICVCERV